MDNWVMIWHQAMTRPLLGGKVYGKNKTVIFKVTAATDGGLIRLKFSNYFGEEPVRISSAAVRHRDRTYGICVDGCSEFSIPVGEHIYSDELMIDAKRNDEIEVRLFLTSRFADCNMIEEGANMLSGNHVYDAEVPPKLRKPAIAKILGAYNAIPAIEAIEIMTEKEVRPIVAFGDSITALSRWTKPLAARLDREYPGEYVLLNSGISGNCLLYERGDAIGPVFGEAGVRRFRRDVLDIPDVSTVIFALGVNDVSYLNEKTRDVINADNFIDAVTSITEQLHSKGVRVVAQTITPRLGVARTMGKYDRDMESLRLELNKWIRSAGIFDYVVDQEEAVREEREDGFYFGEDLQQGDHLHPNEKGGKLMADTYDLAKLTGRE